MFRYRFKKFCSESEVIFHLLFLLGTEESIITLTITLVWNLIETWGFRVDDSCDFPDNPINGPIIPSCMNERRKVERKKKYEDSSSERRFFVFIFRPDEDSSSLFFVQTKILRLYFSLSIFVISSFIHTGGYLTTNLPNQK